MTRFSKCANIATSKGDETVLIGHAGIYHYMYTISFSSAHVNRDLLLIIVGVDDAFIPRPVQVTSLPPL